MGGKERLRFLCPQQLVHLFTPNLHTNEDVSAHMGELNILHQPGEVSAK